MTEHFLFFSLKKVQIQAMVVFLMMLFIIFGTEIKLKQSENPKVKPEATDHQVKKETFDSLLEQ